MDEKKFISELKSLFGQDDLDLLLQTVKSRLEENDMLNMAIDNGVDSLHISNRHGIILRVNKVFEERTKVKREYIEGKSVLEVEKEGLYGPTIVPLAVSEKRKISIIQTGLGGIAIATANPIIDENGEITYVVSNARFLEELEPLYEYYKNRTLKTESIKLAQNSIVAKSKAMRDVLNTAAQVAESDSNILLTGETGVGKSVIARYIHEHSKRSNQKFIDINCAAIPENLIESELFGYTTGSFTGARKGGKAGMFEYANGGTLLLDEIGDMPLGLQVRLLKVIQNKTVTRIGGENEIPVDVRIITATNQNLESMVKGKTFRSDLYYRINVVPIEIPPLRERIEDIEVLIDLFLEKGNVKYGKSIALDKGIRDSLVRYNWPGNIRELENLIERLVVTNLSGMLTASEIPKPMIVIAGSSSEAVKVNRITPLKETLEEVEKQLILMAFEAYSNSYKAAEVLGISQSGANRKYLKYKEK